MTLTAPRGKFNEPMVFHLEGRALIGGKQVYGRLSLPTI